MCFYMLAFWDNKLLKYQRCEVWFGQLTYCPDCELEQLLVNCGLTLARKLLTSIY